MFNNHIKNLFNKNNTLVSLVKDKRIDLDETIIEQTIEFWHEEYKGKMELHELLGIPWEEYKTLLNTTLYDLLIKQINKQKLASSDDNSGNLIDSSLSNDIKKTNEFLRENYHLCLVCNGTGKDKLGKPCKICEHGWKSQAVREPRDTMVDGGGKDNTTSFLGFDKGWDL